MSDSHSHEDVQKHIKTYMMIFASLAVLTVVTVAVGYMDLSIWPALILALVIATIKGGLVAAHFMHLISEKKMIYHLLILTFVFLFFMFLLFTWAYNDQQGTVSLLMVM